MAIMSSLRKQNPKQKQRGHSFENYPLYCPKCKQETLIDVKNLQITVIKEPDA